jgi:hypothetical protein
MSDTGFFRALTTSEASPENFSSWAQPLVQLMYLLSSLPRQGRFEVAPKSVFFIEVDDLRLNE